MRKFEYLEDMIEFMPDPDLTSKNKLDPYVLVMDTETGTVYTGHQFYKEQFLIDDVSEFLGVENV